MKFRLLALVLGVFVLMSSCGSKQETLRLYMWADNIPRDVYQEFEKETGIRIIDDAASSNEEMYAKVKSGASIYDIITPSLDYSEIMLKEGLLFPVDKAMVPNVSNIDPNIMKHIYVIDTNAEYIIPFAFGPTVIAYDSSVVTEPIKGFEIYSNPKYKGKMMLLNDMREVMSSALLISGYEIGADSPEALSATEKLLRVWKDNILRFDADSFQIAYANGEVDIVHGYIDTIIPNLSQERKAVTKFIIPDKGAMIWVDNFLILKDAPNKEAAMKFINFIHRPDIYARIMDHIGSLSLNVPARDLMNTKSEIDYKDLERTSMLSSISDEALAAQSRVWENIQAE